MVWKKRKTKGSLYNSTVRKRLFGKLQSLCQQNGSKQGVKNVLCYRNLFKILFHWYLWLIFESRNTYWIMNTFILVAATSADFPYEKNWIEDLGGSAIICWWILTSRRAYCSWVLSDVRKLNTSVLKLPIMWNFPLRSFIYRFKHYRCQDPVRV
jgi:hypothetical protein